MPVPFRRSRGQEGVAASLAQGGGLGAVLAGGGAEPARVVATGVDVGPAAVRVAAQADPVPMAGGQEPAESLGADRGPHLNRRRVTGVVVHAPAAVFLGEMWVGGVCGEHRVEAGGRGVIVAASEVGDDAVQLLAERDEPGNVLVAHLLHRPGVNRQDPGQRVQALTTVLLDDEPVDEVDGHMHPGICVTVQTHLTSVLASPYSQVTVVRAYDSDTRSAGEVAEMTGIHGADLTEPAVRIRAASRDDVDVTARVWRAAWLDGHRGRVPDALLAIREPEYFAAKAAEMVASTLLAVDGSGAIVGVAIVAGDELSQLAVDREARRVGTGSSLLAAAEARIAARFDEAWLYVVPDNTGAREFYERHGWIDAGATIFAAPAGDRNVDVPVHRYVKTVR